MIAARPCSYSRAGNEESPLRTARGDWQRGAPCSSLRGQHDRARFRLHPETIAVHAGRTIDPADRRRRSARSIFRRLFERAADGSYPHGLQLHAQRQSEPRGARTGARRARRRRGRGGFCLAAWRRRWRVFQRSRPTIT